eukprot:gene2660-3069_t
MRPGTPTGQLQSTTSPTLSGRPGTPSKASSAALSALSAQANAIIEKSEPIEAVTEAKFESRFKNIDMETRIMRGQIADLRNLLSEKDRQIEALNDRNDELEAKMNTFMEEIKLVLLTSMEGAEQTSGDY